MSVNKHPSPENVSSFIDQMLRTKDPAAVGLKRILRKKEDEKNDYPLRTAALEDFNVAENGTKKLSVEERHILELEKKTADLQIAFRRQNEKAAAAIQAAYTKGKTEGRESGRNDGLKTATESYQKKVDLLQQRIEAVLLDLESSKKLMFHNTEHILMQLCMEMVKKIIRREISEHHDIVLSVLKHALSYIGHHEKMIIRVAPGDIEMITGRKDFWAPVGERLKDITIETDERISPGGCILESNAGMVDATLGVQISELGELVETTWAEIHSAIVAGVDETRKGNGSPSGNEVTVGNDGPVGYDGPGRTGAHDK
jgi:flagellar assembly protein FliH